MFGLSPLVILVIVAGLSFGAGSLSGFKVESWRWSAADLAATVAAEKAHDAEAAKENAASASLEQKKDEIRVVYRTITKRAEKIVDRPIYVNACFDDDGLRIVNDALSGSAADPGKSDPALPAAKPPG